MSRFGSPTVSFGIVVSDIKKSIAFYRDAIGMIEAGDFGVPAAMGGDSGLSDYQSFQVHIMKLADSDEATDVKLMQFTGEVGEKVEKISNDYIHDAYGIRYLTVLVRDIDEAVERARKAGAPPIAKGPILLPEGFPEGVYLACVREPDGNIVELIGPNG